MRQNKVAQNTYKINIEINKYRKKNTKKYFKLLDKTDFSYHS